MTGDDRRPTSGNPESTSYLDTLNPVERFVDLVQAEGIAARPSTSVNSLCSGSNS